MKIQVNYDLLSKVAEANVGFSLNKSVKRVLVLSAITTSIVSLISIGQPMPLETFVICSMNNVLIHVCGTAVTNIVLKDLSKLAAKIQLKNLSSSLKAINVNTCEELLKKSYKYKTEYALKTEDNSFPKLEQKKYIMIPVYEGGKEKEVSIVQEHIIGTDKYNLSYGEPKKVLKLSFSP